MPSVKRWGHRLGHFHNFLMLGVVQNILEPQAVEKYGHPGTVYHFSFFYSVTYLIHEGHQSTNYLPINRQKEEECLVQEAQDHTGTNTIRERQNRSCWLSCCCWQKTFDLCWTDFEAAFPGRIEWFSSTSELIPVLTVFRSHANKFIRINIVNYGCFIASSLSIQNLQARQKYVLIK